MLVIINNIITVITHSFNYLFITKPNFQIYFTIFQFPIQFNHISFIHQKTILLIFLFILTNLFQIFFCYMQILYSIILF